MPAVLRDLSPERVERRVSILEDAPLATQRLVEVTLAAGANDIRHGLPRARGRVVVRISAVVDLFDVDNADSALWTVNSSGAATALFLFF